jgi:hypothetical protein
MKSWKMQNIETSDYIGILELADGNYFEVVKTDKKLVFGNSTNIGLLQSGYMIIDNCFSIDENLQELHAELETYYSDGKQYCSMIVVNDRM